MYDLVIENPNVEQRMSSSLLSVHVTLLPDEQRN